MRQLARSSTALLAAHLVGQAQAIDPTQALIQSPSMQAVLADIAAQTRAEASQLQPGADLAIEIAIRQNTLVQSFSDLYRNSSNLDAGQVLNAAKSFVGQNHTVAGAIDTAAGLVDAVAAAASGAPPSAVFSNFAGPLVGGLVLTGALAAGVGAAIVGGVAMVGAILDKITGEPSTAVKICGSTLPSAPDISIGCVVGFDNHAGPISPSSKLWRPFPEPSRAADAPWFSTGESAWQGGAFSWQGGVWTVIQGHGRGRTIDAAFWDYDQVSSDAAFVPDLGGQIPQLSLQPFAQGFFTAWKAAAAYALNGLKNATAAQTLEQFLRIWNRAHERSMQLTLRQGATYLGRSYYAASLVDAVLRGGATDILSPDGSGVVINLGPLKPKLSAPPITTTVPIHLGGTRHFPPPYAFWTLDQWAQHYVPQPAAAAASLAALASLGPGFKLGVKT
jgi:hypothetical protein